VGLSTDIQDWLKGNRRMASSTADAVFETLQEVADQDMLVAVASLLAETVDMHLAGGSPSSDAGGQLQRLLNRINSIASQQRLEIVGRPGDIVDFSPTAHDTATHALPSEPRVKIVRPMVVRKRRDGGQDVLVKALVTET
jgi:hypothetical protein